MKLSQKIIEKFEYNEFYENFPAVILSLKLVPNQPTECLFISENCLEYLGYSSTELMKDWGIFKTGVGDKDWKYLKSKIEDCIRLQQKLQIKFLYTFKDGTSKWLRLNANILVKHDYTELQGIISDITDEKHAEVKEDKLKSALIHIARHPVICNGEIENLSEFCSKIISDTLNVSRSGLWFYDSETNILNCDKLYIKEEDKFDSGLQIFGNDYPEYISILNEAPYILANDARNNEATRRFTDVYLRPYNIYSLLDVPIVYKGKIVAVLCQEQTKKIRIWQKSEINFLFQVGEFISYCFAISERNRFELEMTYLNQNLQKLVDDKTTELLNKTKELEEKNREILESISYSSKIQASILPGQTRLKELLPEHLIYYNPKDIVAGDFYWIQTIENKTLFAVCDCTGHGIPGAFVSIMAYKILERTVSEFKLKEPEDILKKANELFNIHFNRPELEVRDGMAIGLIQIEKLEDGKSYIKYSGAYMPMYVADIENNLQINKINPTRASLGLTPIETQFNTVEFSLNKGSVIYFFTDGCSDQFGGEKGKKLKRKNFIRILQENISYEFPIQLKNISSSINDWKGNFEQLDDMCLTAIRF